MPPATVAQVVARLGRLPDVQARRIRPLKGGMIAAVFRVDLADGRTMVCKLGDMQTRLDIEAAMLRYLARTSRLPLPEVLYCARDLLLMTFIEGDSELDGRAQEHCAELLADLHSLTRADYGHECDTLIGPLLLPNRDERSWIRFFREQRLLHFAQVALEAGAISAPLMARLERLAARLECWLAEPAEPSLLHGDIWATNILARGGRVRALLDPAIYYGHDEIELAYTTLFGSRGRTFGPAFYRRYQELRPIAPGFLEERRHIYNLYPLLVHARIFGGHYPGEVARILARFGC